MSVRASGSIAELPATARELPCGDRIRSRRVAKPRQLPGYRSRLGDELTNWAIYEGHQLDKILEPAAIIAADEPDLVAALETLDLMPEHAV
jgi:hypothetical protein